VSTRVETPDRVREPFADRKHQRRSTVLGMWAFLAQEAVFFAALFSFYASLRVRMPEVVAAGARATEMLFGAVMTALLLASSAAVVFALRFAEQRRRGPLVAALGLTWALGVAFLIIKGFEYVHHFAHGQTPWAASPTAPFWSVYLVTTGFHALHVLAGIGVFSVLIVAALRDRLRTNVVLASALYWHFVDIVWIFLFPLLYLIDPTRGGAA
jgi:cytochrome c oxidase subunit 3